MSSSKKKKNEQEVEIRGLKRKFGFQMKKPRSPLLLDG